MHLPCHENSALAQLLTCEGLSNEEKLGYLKLNTQIPIPNRDYPGQPSARFREFVSPQHAQFAFGKGCDCSSYVEFEDWQS
jgi:hypothetical protein